MDILLQNRFQKLACALHVLCSAGAVRVAWRDGKFLINPSLKLVRARQVDGSPVVIDVVDVTLYLLARACSLLDCDLFV